MPDYLTDGLNPNAIPKLDAMPSPAMAQSPVVPSPASPVNPVPKIPRARAPVAAMPQRPAAAAPAPDPNAQIRNYVQDQLNDVRSEQTELGKKAAADYAQAEADLAKMKQDHAAELDAHMANKPAPVPEFKPQQASDLSGMLMVLAALGGTLTRAPLTASLNNFAAMLQGHAAGDQQRFQQEFEQFQANAKKGIEASRAYNDELKEIREKHRGDLAALTEAKRDLDARYGKQEQLLNDRGKNLMEMQKAITDEANTRTRAAQEADRQLQLAQTWALGLMKNNEFNAKLAETAAEHQARLAEADAKRVDAENRDRRHVALAREGMAQKHQDAVDKTEKQLTGKIKEDTTKALDKLADELAQGKISKEQYQSAVDTVMSNAGLKVQSPAAAGRTKPGSAPPPDVQDLLDKYAPQQ